VPDDCMMKLTTKFRMPVRVCQSGASEVQNFSLTLTLVARQNSPSCEDNIVQYLKSNVCPGVSYADSSFQVVDGRLAFCLWVACLLEDLVNEKPRVGVLFKL
jgi:hypothetical protein